MLASTERLKNTRHTVEILVRNQHYKVDVIQRLQRIRRTSGCRKLKRFYFFDSLRRKYASNFLLSRKSY